MDKYEIVRTIESFAPPELAEGWDCSGWLVETSKKDVKKVMLCLTVTNDVVNQAINADCDMIISHHPLFFINFPLRERVPMAGDGLIDIYCAHTNLDKAQGGTTDTLINTIFPLPMGEGRISSHNVCDRNLGEGYIRYVELNMSICIKDFVKKLFKLSPNLRYVNNFNVEKIQKIAFCAGSGSEFIAEAKSNGADALVTGDIKFHTALDSEIVLFDIGHFESEILVLNVFEKLINDSVDIVYADEKSPFIYQNGK